MCVHMHITIYIYRYVCTFMCKYKSLMHAGNSKEFAYSPIPQLAQKRCHIHTIDAYVQLVNMSIQLPC